MLHRGWSYRESLAAQMWILGLILGCVCTLVNNDPSRPQVETDTWASIARRRIRMSSLRTSNSHLMTGWSTHMSSLLALQLPVAQVL
jgi:hypothetical protein